MDSSSSILHSDPNFNISQTSLDTKPINISSSIEATEATPLLASVASEVESIATPILQIKKPEEKSLDKEIGAFKVANKILRPFNVQDMKPGDIICTYESTYSNPIKYGIGLGQKLLFHEENIEKMQHFEIVLEKREGSKVLIAHVNGASKTVAIEEQDLSQLEFGTSAVFIRPKQEELGQKMVEIAKATGHRGNRWKIDLLDNTKDFNLKKLGKLDRFIYKKLFIDEQKSIRKLANLTVDSNYAFKKKNGTDLLEMSCVQYISNILNASLLRMDPRFKEIIENPSYQTAVENWSNKSEQYQHINAAVQTNRHEGIQLQVKLGQLDLRYKKLSKKVSTTKETSQLETEKETIKAGIKEIKTQITDKNNQLKDLRRELQPLEKDLANFISIRENVVNQLIKKFEEENIQLEKLQDVLSPGGLLHDQVSSAGLFLKMIKADQHWNVLGYAGENADAVQPLAPSSIELSAKKLDQLGLGTGQHVLDVFKVCGLLDKEGKFVIDVHSLQTVAAFTYLYGEKNNLSSFSVGDYLAVNDGTLNRIHHLEGSQAIIKNATLQFGQFKTEMDTELKSIKKEITKAYEGEKNILIRDIVAKELKTFLTEKIESWIEENKDHFELKPIDKENLFQLLEKSDQMPSAKFEQTLLNIITPSYAKKHALQETAIKDLYNRKTVISAYKKSPEELEKFQETLYAILYPSEIQEKEAELPLAVSEQESDEWEIKEEIVVQDKDPSIQQEEIEANAVIIEEIEKMERNPEIEPLLSQTEPLQEEIKEIVQEETKEVIKTPPLDRKEKVDISKILKIEEHIIKNSGLSRSDTAEAWQTTQITKSENMTRKITFKAKLLVGAALALFPIAIIIGLIALPIILASGKGKMLLTIAKELPRTLKEMLYTEKNTEVWRTKIRGLRAAQRPNFRLRLETQVENGKRPWVWFSPDGKTWKAHPLVLEPNSTTKWITKIHANSESSLQYKYFIGPDNVNHSTPHHEAVWQKMEGNNVMNSENFASLKDSTGLIAAPICHYPEWG